MMNEEEITVSEALGRRIRRLRDYHGLLQGDIARTARDLGLDWTQATVAAIETGRRKISLDDELFALPVILTVATGTEVVLSDLFQGDERTNIGPFQSAPLRTVFREAMDH